MKFALDNAIGVNTISGYEPGMVRIRDRAYSRSLIVLRDRVITDWTPGSAAGLQAQDLEPLLHHDPEIVILGTGETQRFPDPSVFAALMARGIGFEVMTNAAACRTYNVLLSESRRAALALILAADPTRGEAQL